MPPSFVLPDDVKNGFPSKDDPSSIKSVTEAVKSGNSGLGNITELVKEGNKLLDGITNLIKMGQQRQEQAVEKPVEKPTTPQQSTFSQEPTILKEKVKPIIAFNSKGAILQLKTLLNQAMEKGFIDKSKSLDYFLTNEIPQLEEAGILESALANFVNSNLEVKYP